MAKFKTIDEYLAALSNEHKLIGTVVRKAILEAVPGLTETIRYDIPSFQFQGSTLIYFAVWKKYVGLYPIYQGTAEFENEIAPYRAKKDTVQFLHNRPIPVELIAKIVRAQLAKRESAKPRP